MWIEPKRMTRPFGPSTFQIAGEAVCESIAGAETTQNSTVAIERARTTTTPEIDLRVTIILHVLATAL